MEDLSAGAKDGVRHLGWRAMNRWVLSVHSIATIAPDRLGYSINQNFYLIYSVH